MLEGILKGITKLFGNKSDKDIKQLLPRVEEINKIYEGLKNISDDELRQKSADLKVHIRERLSDIEAEISSMKQQADETLAADIAVKEQLYKEVDKKEKERDTLLEVVLDEILHEAFAITKETARRFTENGQITVEANDWDKEMSTRKKNVTIKDGKATWSSTWDVRGNAVTWNMVHYDVQLIGGMVLHQGKIAEMGTGEGKTLVSTLPSFLNALSGYGVHLVTVNDYLAKRDAEWNAPLFEFHGLKVECIDNHQPNSTARRDAYLADITYGTNNEFGFDYLRDNMAHEVGDLVQRKHHFAMVDEVDSVLIDDARTPLIISGPTPKGDQHEFTQLKPRIEKLVNAQRKYLNNALNDAKKLIAEGKDNEKEGGLLLFRVKRGLPKSNALIKYLGEPNINNIFRKTENFYLGEQMKNMPVVDEALYFVIDEKNNSIELTDRGIDLITDEGEDKEFFIMPDMGSEIADIEKTELSDIEKRKAKEELSLNFSIKSERIHSINQLLKAYCMFERDVEYIIDGGKVKIVDEQTGRVLDGRRYSDGLHQAIEAKENVKIEAVTQTYATVTLQNFFRMYHKLAGMTGTAETEAGEFWEIYKLDVVVIPTNRPIIRDDKHDLIYKTKREKYNALIEEIVKISGAGRPILVGTTSVEVSELLSRMMKLRGIKHNVLNAKQHEREAEVVAEAGTAGTVTIATNMAGRGTDIKLGTGVYEAGGLAILGTERHESRRVDRQLRGRAGRQGDPGSSQFFISLEDDLMRLFAAERIAKAMDWGGHQEGEFIQHPIISRSVESAQKKVEQNNFGSRKRLLEYDDVMNTQREEIYKRRRNALFGQRLDIDLDQSIKRVLNESLSYYHGEGDYEGFMLDMIRVFAVDPEMDKKDFTSQKFNVVFDAVYEKIKQTYQSKNEGVIQTAMPVITQIYQERGQQIENIVVPFTDGIKTVNVATPLQKTIDTNGKELITSFEKITTLANIDDEWKEHLREMDDLKQAVQNAYLEQKDPLLIYKLESADLFINLTNKLNRDIISMLSRGKINTTAPEPVKEAREVRRDTPNVKAGREELSAGGGSSESEVSRTPVKTELKVGRNDLCPCGSGKKYKSCHGANA